MRSLLVVVCAALLVAACGGATRYRPSAGLTISANPELEIDDEAIAKAFEASPQMVIPARVAYFNVDPARDAEIEAVLRSVPTVAEVYALPRLLVTGERRFEEPNPLVPERRELSIRRLRLLAARAHCDLVLVFDYGHQIETVPNGWVAMNALMIPTLFMPFLDSDVESYLDAYVIDTRNGYLYAKNSETRRAEADGLTIWSSADQRLADSLWTDMLGKTQAALNRILRAPPKAPPERGGERLGGLN